MEWETGRIGETCKKCREMMAGPAVIGARMHAPMKGTQSELTNTAHASQIESSEMTLHIDFIISQFFCQ